MHWVTKCIIIYYCSLKSVVWEGGCCAFGACRLFPFLSFLSSRMSPKEQLRKVSQVQSQNIYHRQTYSLFLLPGKGTWLAVLFHRCQKSHAESVCLEALFASFMITDKSKVKLAQKTSNNKYYDMLE